jgi:molybdate transport system ATP-binding protein
MTPPLVRLDNVDVALAGKTILRGVSWRLRSGEHWAILGENGSGKSTLLRLIRGELWPEPGHGRRVYALDGAEQTTAVGVKESMACVSPELQQRYLQQEWRLTGRQVIESGFGGGDYRYQPLKAGQQKRAARMARLLGVEQLLGRNAQELSTGELRRVLIARALVAAPRVLVCDEICDGVDAAARAGLLATLDRVARNGTQLLFTTHRAEELVPAIRHRLVLERGRIVECGRLEKSVRRGQPPRPVPTAVESRTDASANLLPLPARHERGEGRGEGRSKKNGPPLPGPLLPRREERENLGHPAGCRPPLPSTPERPHSRINTFGRNSAKWRRQTGQLWLPSVSWNSWRTPRAVSNSSNC